MEQSTPIGPVQPNGYEVWPTSKEETKKIRFTLKGLQPCNLVLRRGFIDNQATGKFF